MLPPPPLLLGVHWSLRLARTLHGACCRGVGLCGNWQSDALLLGTPLPSCLLPCPCSRMELLFEFFRYMWVSLGVATAALALLWPHAAAGAGMGLCFMPLCRHGGAASCTPLLADVSAPPVLLCKC